MLQRVVVALGIVVRFCVCGSVKLDNGAISADVEGAGITHLFDRELKTLIRVDDKWQMQVEAKGQNATLTPSVCVAEHPLPVLSAVAGNSTVLSWRCNAPAGVVYIVNASYSLGVAQRFVSKTLRVSSSESAFRILTVDVWNSALSTGSDCPSYVVHRNPRFAADIVALARFTGVSMYASVANPFVSLTPSTDKNCPTLRASYSPQMEHNASFPEPFHETEPGVLGFAARGKYAYDDGIFVGEKAAFRACVESFLLDGAFRRNKTVKVQVAWDVSDYQIDVGTPAGVNEYKRIIDQNARLGVEHIVYEPQNSLHSSRFNTTDGWGWEMALWFSLGEQIREGRWNAQRDPVPQDILDMVSYARSRGVKLLAYVYPCLAFQEVKQYEFGGYNVLDLSQPPAAEWLLETLSAFMVKTGAGGFAWDHDIFTAPARPYPQWRAWSSILSKLRARFPDIVMDHRQQNHVYGPWYQMAGSYAEPLGSDENPETYGVFIPTLHADHVAADQVRKINYGYAADQLIPASRVPGFMFHQVERRAPNGSVPCEGSNKVCFSLNTRDFDLMGYKYSVLSNVASAGLNHVLTEIPARDLEEYQLFPKEDLDFIHDWISWSDGHMDALRNAAPISSLPRPGIGGVDGWHAMRADGTGFLFLFNPNFQRLTANISIDEAIGISNASSEASWIALELYPNSKRHSRGPWKHSDVVTLEVEGSGVLVLELQKASVGRVPQTAGVGRKGELVRVDSRVPELAELRCGLGQPRQVEVRFASEPVYHAMPIAPDAVAPKFFTGTWFNTTFMIPAAIKQQLQARAQKYPINWTQHDLSATWLAPSRLLMTVFLGKPQIRSPVRMWINATEVTVGKASNSKDSPSSASQETFLGYFYDASALHIGVTHKVSVLLPDSPDNGFQGLFWENIETEYTAEIASCQEVEPLFSEQLFI